MRIVKNYGQGRREMLSFFVEGGEEKKVKGGKECRPSKGCAFIFF
jgi:hypothetical protein